MNDAILHEKKSMDYANKNICMKVIIITGSQREVKIFSHILLAAAWLFRKKNNLEFHIIFSGKFPNPYVSDNAIYCDRNICLRKYLTKSTRKWMYILYMDRTCNCFHWSYGAIKSFRAICVPYSMLESSL